MSLQPSNMGGVAYAQVQNPQQHNQFQQQIDLNAHEFPAPNMTRWDDGSQPSNQQPKTQQNAYHQGYIHAAPFTPQTYQTDPYMDDRVYTGIYTDPETGEQFHTYEDALPDQEHDESINNSSQVMERLFEMHTGGLGGDAMDRLGLPHYKPEQNLKEAPLTPYDAWAKYNGDPVAQRSWDASIVNANVARTAENNFSGIREDMGNAYGYNGLQPLVHAHVRDLGLVHRPEDLDHQARAQTATAQNESAAPRTDPQLRTNPEATTTWIPQTTYGHVMGGIRVNQFPGDKEAQAMYGQGQQHPLHPAQDMV